MSLLQAMGLVPVVVDEFSGGGIDRIELNGDFDIGKVIIRDFSHGWVLL